MQRSLTSPAACELREPKPQFRVPDLTSSSFSPKPSAPQKALILVARAVRPICCRADCEECLLHRARPDRLVSLWVSGLRAVRSPKKATKHRLNVGFLGVGLWVFVCITSDPFLTLRGVPEVPTVHTGSFRKSPATREYNQELQPVKNPPPNALTSRCVTPRLFIEAAVIPA